MKGTPIGTEHRRYALRAGIGSAVAALTLIATGGQAAANKFEVTTTDASGKGSLTAAVKQSREKVGGDQIKFAKRLRGQIDLPSQLTLKGKVSITGNGYGDPDDKNFKRVQLRGHRGGSVILVDQESNGALRGLYLDGTSVKAPRSSVTVRESFLQGQRTVDQTGISGGGEETRILATTVEGFDRGVATSGLARIDESTIADNVGGGGVSVNGGSMDVSNSTISGNVVNGQDGPFVFAVGGGLNASQFGASARVTNSTIVRNQAISSSSNGGGLYGNVQVVNSTISGNRAAEGAGIAGAGTADVDVANSIIYGNTTFGGDASDCGDPFTSSGGNLVGDPGECLLDATDVSGVDPLLSPLGDYGGPTETMTLGQGSPAVGLAVKSTASKFDQRGILRDDDPDAGATERKG